MITPTTLLVLLVAVGLMWLVYKKFHKDQIDEAIDRAHNIHEQAEKAKTVDIKQYQKDKKAVDRIKDLH